MKEGLKPIPIGDAERIAKERGYHQIVVIGRKVGVGGGEHVTTYGVDPVHCDVAGRIGDYLKRDFMKWPEDVTAQTYRRPSPEVTALVEAARNGLRFVLGTDDGDREYVAPQLEAALAPFEKQEGRAL